jgi:ATP-dependent Clp protease ATP-binding subunit ClpA
VPFINEVLRHNLDVLEREKLAQGSARVSRFKFDVSKVMAHLRGRIVGQPSVLRAMEDLLTTVKADFCVASRPLGITLFVGPTGVGKTETVRILAEALLGSADRICRIDMNTLAQQHYSAALTGSPPGYVGSKEGQTLFNEDLIKGNFSEPGIVLFDEIEKADTDVVRAIMNVLDTGKMNLTSGSRVLDFTNCLVFMTSNIGVKAITSHIVRHQKGWRKWFRVKPASKEGLIDSALHGHFDPEFLNRIDRILLFEPLHRTQLDDLLSIEIEQLNRRLSRKHAALNLDSGARAYLVRDYDPRFGARDLARRIRVELEPLVAKAILEHPHVRQFTARTLQAELTVAPET